MTDRSRSFASEADARAWIAHPDTAPSPASGRLTEAQRDAICDALIGSVLREVDKLGLLRPAPAADCGPECAEQHTYVNGCEAAPTPDPREIGPQWEDRLTDAIHPAGGREWTYTERTELVMATVRELLWERVTPLLAAPCPGYETAPNTCRCDCEGCQHHCAAHQDAAPVPPAEQQLARLKDWVAADRAEHPSNYDGYDEALRDIQERKVRMGAAAQRDQIAEAVHATSVCEVGDPVRCGGGCRDAADAVLPIGQHTAQLRADRDRLDDELRRVSALHADTERRLRADLADEVRKREEAEATLRRVEDTLTTLQADADHNRSTGDPALLHTASGYTGAVARVRTALDTTEGT